MASRLKFIRLRKEIKQEELALITGYSQAFISFIESGKREPSQENLLIFAEALGCSVTELYSGGLKKSLLTELRDEIKTLSEIELEKALDYIQLLKKAKR